MQEGLYRSGVWAMTPVVLVQWVDLSAEPSHETISELRSKYAEANMGAPWRSSGSDPKTRRWCGIFDSKSPASNFKRYHLQELKSIFPEADAYRRKENAFFPKNKQPFQKNLKDSSNQLLSNSTLSSSANRNSGLWMRLYPLGKKNKGKKKKKRLRWCEYWATLVKHKKGSLGLKLERKLLYPRKTFSKLQRSTPKNSWVNHSFYFAKPWAANLWFNKGNSRTDQGFTIL